MVRLYAFFLIISKQNEKSTIRQYNDSSFDYQENQNALIGKTGYYYCFYPKRIIVIQMI